MAAAGGGVAIPTFRVEAATVQLDSVLALDDITLEIAEGERVAVVGPSGCGKTTLLRLFNATRRPSTGRVLIQGDETTQLSPRQLRTLRAHIGFIYQDFRLVPNFRVIQNVLVGRIGAQSFIASLRRIFFSNRKETAEVHTILDRVGIAEKLYERTDRLSGGQQQRVAIARALYQQPIALLADEPFASVDPARAAHTLRLISDIATEQRLTLCMSLHDLALARKYFPRLIGLRGGRVCFDRATDDITEEEFHRLYEIEDEDAANNRGAER